MMGVRGHWGTFILGGEFGWTPGYPDPFRMTWVPGVFWENALGDGLEGDWEADLAYCTNFVPELSRPRLVEALVTQSAVPKEILTMCWVHETCGAGEGEPEWGV